MTPVIFRKFNSDGEIIAIFPTIPGDHRYNCMSYMHIGQHGACSPDLTQAHTTLAGENEYKPLLNELVSIGYDDLKIVKRNHPSYRAQLIAELDTISKH